MTDPLRASCPQHILMCDILTHYLTSCKGVRRHDKLFDDLKAALEYFSHEVILKKKQKDQ